MAHEQQEDRPLVLYDDRRADSADLLTTRRSRTTALVNIAAALERLDEQLAPSLYRSLGAAFGATPRQLGALSLCRAAVQALSSPLGGFAGQHYSRAHVLAAGCCVWGACTAAFGLCGALWQAMLVWSVNGLGLALVVPTTQSLTADLHPPATRGAAFGWLALTAAAGGMLGSLFGTSIGGRTVLGTPGWRVVLLSTGAASAAVGLASALFVVDPPLQGTAAAARVLHHASAGAEDSPMAGVDAPPCRPRFGWRAAARELRHVCAIPTFVLIVVQGILGTSAWPALAFLTLYFQLLGLPDSAAGALVALLLAGAALGSLLGGHVGDFAAARWPRHGRIVAAQASVLSGPPFVLLLLKVLPQDARPGSVAAYALTIGVFSLLKTWAAPACNNPLFAEVVPPRSRNLVYALDRCLEGSLAALSAPLVGWLAEAGFGFSGDAAASGDPARDRANARALGNAILAMTALPWALCGLLYTGLHVTYARDRARAAVAALVAGAGGKAPDQPA